MTSKKCINCAHRCINDSCASDRMVVCNHWEPVYDFTILHKESFEIEKITLPQMYEIAFEFRHEHPNYETYYDGDTMSLKARLKK